MLRPRNLFLHCGWAQWAATMSKLPKKRGHLQIKCPLPATAGGKDFPVLTAVFPKALSLCKLWFPGWVSTGQFVQSRKGYVRAHEHGGSEARLWHPAHHHAESAGSLSWLRQGSPFCWITSQSTWLREALQSCTVRDNLREGAGQGRAGGKCVSDRQSPVFQMAELEHREGTRTNLLLLLLHCRLPLFPFIFPQQVEELLTMSMLFGEEVWVN